LPDDLLILSLLNRLIWLVWIPFGLMYCWLLGTVGGYLSELSERLLRKVKHMYGNIAINILKLISHHFSSKSYRQNSLLPVRWLTIATIPSLALLSTTFGPIPQP
jgi:hypothetical protein